MKNLIIVDMQKGQMREGNSSLISSINKLLNENKFENVFYTRYFNHEESLFYSVLEYKEMLGEDEIEICVDSVEDSFIFPKETYALAKEQIAYIKNMGLKEIYLCGTDIDTCILAIAFRLFDNGIRPYFIWPLCATKNKDQSIKDAIKPLLRRNFGEDCIIEKI